MQGLAKRLLAAAAVLAVGTATAANLLTKIVRPRPMLGPVSTRQWRPLVRSVSYGRGRQTPDRHGPQRRTRR